MCADFVCGLIKMMLECKIVVAALEVFDCGGS